jgi:DNA-binding transcriptional MerR regulator
MHDDNATLAIGELARRAGTAPSALRYYERIGLLPAAERAGGKRHYPPSSAERLALVRLYQDAGFTLKEIRQLLAAGSDRRGCWTRSPNARSLSSTRASPRCSARRICSNTLSAARIATCSRAPASAPHSKPGSKRDHRSGCDRSHLAHVRSWLEAVSSSAASSGMK